MEPTNNTQTETYNLLAYLAPYLINGDSDGMTHEEVKEIDDWLKEVKPGNCVSCSENQEFRYSNDLNHIGGDCLEYTFLTK